MCVRVQFTRGTVQSQHFYFDRNNFFLLQRIKNTLYYAIFTPSFKSLVNAIPFAVFLWKCPPLAPIFGNIQDSVDKCVIVDFYIPTLNRKILFDSCVLRFCDIHVFIISYFDLSVNMLYIYDFGQNLSGVASLTLTGEAGQTVKLRFAEMLNDASGTGDGREGTLYTQNLRSAKNTDVYILRGDAEGEP